jgi:hypothetical protein
MNNFSHIWAQVRALYTARNEPENIRPLAEIYWRALLAFALIALVGICVWASSEFIGVVSRLNVSEESPMPHPPLDRTALRALLSSMQERQTHFDALKTTAPSFSDPSK